MRTADVELAGITICAGNVNFDQEVENALYTAEMAGRSDVPVFAGCPRPLLRPWVDAAYVHGDDGMGEANFPRAAKRPEPEHGVDALIRMIHASPGELTIVAQAPLTNLAVAVTKDPSIVPEVKDVFIMGGTNNGIGNVTPAAEYNFYVDPEAAKAVLAAGFRVTLVDWNLCLRASVFDDQFLGEIGDLGTPLARYFTQVNRKALEFCHEVGIDGSTHPDTLTCALAIDPTLITRASSYHVGIETQGELTRGYTSVDLLGADHLPANARVVEEVDIQRFRSMFLRVLQA